ncbi:glycosyltransferase family 2 protein [Flavobacterium crassostreae]|uniref:Glycosyltransferase 2-like domain-containing protein n=1 Tax=Flavobacterium crassostreae TaxID=1763534 RepID=A0A1B9E3E8_9FLAO|nr:glycosyltransferase family A protein [Flavobacterium crassostreae]OCB76461.1 hypothetical protein LPBF_05850 [Flavobacterium crassostreae]
MPLFTVVIPLFNKEKFIAATLKSVLDQSYTDFEIIVIDDASTDRSYCVAAALDSTKIKIIKHSFNQGLSATRNTGIKNANAPYIAFLDADDLWDSNFLEEIARLINQFPEAHLFATNYLEIYSNSVALAPEVGLKNTNTNFVVTDFFEASLAQPIYCPSSWCVQKDVFKTTGLYNPKITFAEDIDFNIRANYYFKLAYSTQACVRYRMVSENQITHAPITNKILPDLDVYENWGKEKPSLKKYLDFNRYIFAKMYQIEHNLSEFSRLKNAIDPDANVSGLNYKQRLLLNASPLLLVAIKKIKRFWVQKGIRFTSY